MPDSVTKKRRHLFIDKQFQTKFSFVSLMLSYTLALAVGAFAVYGTILYMNHLRPEHVISSNLRNVISAFYVTAVMVVFWLIIAVVIVTVRQSHRVAGAAYRIRKDLGEVLDGNYQKTIILRKKDNLQELGRDVNHLIQRLKETERDKEFSIQAALELAESIYRNEGAGPEAREMAKRVEEKLAALQKTVQDSDDEGGE